MLLLALLACQNEKPARVCNGASALCDRPFDEVALPATHNAMSNADDGWELPNQEHGLPTQLDDGVRGFLLDTYEEDGELLMCHEYCELGSVSLVEALGWIDDFMESHPDDAFAIIFQDAITPEQTATAFDESGLLDRVYTYEGGDWPTLAEMADADTRLVVGSENQGPPPDWYHAAWELWFDTPYDFSDVGEFSCALNRGETDNPLFLLNHWIGPLPTRDNAAEANVSDVLLARAQQCQAEQGHLPNLVAVDFYDVGDLFTVVNTLNGL